MHQTIEAVTGRFPDRLGPLPRERRAAVIRQEVAGYPQVSVQKICVTGAGREQKRTIKTIVLPLVGPDGGFLELPLVVTLQCFEAVASFAGRF